MNKLLLVDDDPDIRTLLTQYLTQNGFDVTAFADAESLLAGDLEGHALVLDIGLPGMDGLSCCREVRQRSDIPIIMLTAASDDVDRILGLELGADDYMGKPFNPRELLARLRAALRRTQAMPKSAVVLDIARRAVTLGPESIQLTGAEFEVMQVLLERHPDLANRDQLSHALHGRAALAFDRTVDTAISRLRQKLSSIGARDCIRSVRGKGYVLVQPQ